ncbi:MAG: MYXO-CTERM sorting domain-containing protein, partial [Deltaproteobacteria bacterium]|nr:MYXO-CTERM sorting domain-containing protein [Kofleriaceae bacterium]
WMASTCDPCPGPNLGGGDFATLGADVLAGEPGKVAPYEGWDLVLTRLHARYGKTVTEDLVFKKAEAIAGGREHMGQNGKLEERSQPSGVNNFQARYAIRHEWTGAITCKDPVRGRWGGPPNGVGGGGAKPALDLAFAPRGKTELATLVRQDIPEIEVKAAGAAGPATETPKTDPAAGASGTGAGTQEPKKKTGCGCAAGTEGGAGALGLAAVVGLVLTRRRRKLECAS